MKTHSNRVYMLIASSDIDDETLMHFAEEIGKSGGKRFVSIVRQMRRQLLRDHWDTEENLYKQFPGGRYSDTPEKVERLLIAEAGLPKAVAIDLLSQMLAQYRPEIEIPHDSKRGFLSWVRKLSEVVPESEILHLATILRNNYVHGKDHDWRFR
jgi:hypothetical protein